MEKIFITVIIPTFNSDRFIKEALDSVYSQTYKEYEVIVIDDGSEDKTSEICSQYFDKVNFNFVKKEHTGNIAFNRNIAINMAKGSYIAFLDSDDIWEKHKLEEQIKYVNDFKFICTNAKMINENDEKIKDKYFTDFKKNTELELHNILKNNYIITSTVLVEKKVLIKSKLFDENYGNLAEDYSLWLKIAERNKIKYIDEPMIQYRLHNKNISFSEMEKRENMLLNTLKLRSEYINYSDKYVHNSAKNGIFKIYKELSTFYIYYDKFYKSIKSMINSFRTCKYEYNYSYIRLIRYYLKIIVLKIIGRLTY